MSFSGTPQRRTDSSQPDWFTDAIEQFRARGYVTLSVRIGYDVVLIVSGPDGEAAIVDLSKHVDPVWREAWSGMRQVLPRVPVVVIMPEKGEWPASIDNRVPLTQLSEPIAADDLVRAVDQLLSTPNSS